MTEDSSVLDVTLCRWPSSSSVSKDHSAFKNYARAAGIVTSQTTWIFRFTDSTVI